MIVLNRIFPRFVPESGVWTNSIIPTLLPDSFWISAGLKYNWQQNTVTKNGAIYQLPSDISMRLPSIEEWEATEGNRIDTTYYNRAEEGNPSGKANIKERKYYDGNNIKMYHILYKWNMSNNIVSEQSMFCDGNDVIEPPKGDPSKTYTLSINDNNNPHVPEGGKWIYEFRGGSIVAFEPIRKEIEHTRADEGMKLKFVNPNTTAGYTYDFNFEFEVVEDVLVQCSWIPANE